MQTKPNSEGGLRILLLDDDPLDMELMRAILEKNLICYVVGIRTRPEFIAAVDERMPDVIISDSNVPSFDGLEALALTLIICPQVPFIFCSGNESPALKEAALARGAKDWVSKNDLEGMVKIVRQVCAKD